MHDNATILENRLRRELNEHIRPAAISARHTLGVKAHHLSGEPIPVSDLPPTGFEPISPGTPWGTPWGTTWFSIDTEIPAQLDQDRTELLVDLGFTGSGPGFQAEGAIYRNGQIVCGVHPRRRSIPLPQLTTGDPKSGGSHLDLLVEAAANPDISTNFRPSRLGSRPTGGTDLLYTFGGIHLIEYHSDVRALAFELSTLMMVMNTLAVDHPRSQRIRFLIGRALNSLDLRDVPGTASLARPFISEAFAPGACDAAHRTTAVGHAHIDTAWLWPLREARRKCARTFSNSLQLMAERSDYRFTCSQAVQYSWIQQDHPELFAAMQEKAREGQWVPVGGMWVEADMNLPSGESLLRQFIHGQRYFESNFGAKCTEVWIPDVFGYPGSLPQIFRAAGCERFVTQKLSWNDRNRFPHHSFVWEGIDGSTVLTHFPPVDTYNAEIVPGEMKHAVDTFSEHAWSDHSLMPFGFGDGGGGPSPEMMDRFDLLADLDGMPKMTMGSASEFFDLLESEVAGIEPPIWRGELYFEMHRGTYTSQARTKVGNRVCENLLREAELWLAILSVAQKSVAENSTTQNTVDPSRIGDAMTTLDALWKRLLVHQFHDIIPGSSIAWVHEDTEREHTEIAAATESLITLTLDSLRTSAPVVASPRSHPGAEVVTTDGDVIGHGTTQRLTDGRTAFYCGVSGLGLSPALALACEDHVEVNQRRLSNQLVTAILDDFGNLVSLLDRRDDREVIPADRAVHLNIAPDHPVEFDAWNLEQWTAGLAVPLSRPESIEILEQGPLRGSIRVVRAFGDSRLIQTYVLNAGSARLDIQLEIDWHESEKLLALEVPLDLRSNTAECEIQFGHESRPTHGNTSWDDAKFEVCAHRWVDITEPDFGVAVLNNGRYGHQVQSSGIPGDHSRIRVSLLRAPLYPDPSADQGHHEVTISLLPHGPGLEAVLGAAEALNMELRVIPPADSEAERRTSSEMAEPLVRVKDENVAVSALKPADDGSGDVILRIYEACGRRTDCAIVLNPDIVSAEIVDIYEDPMADAEEASLVVSSDQGQVTMRLRPFQLITLRLHRA